jgi:hypothetical protein
MIIYKLTNLDLNGNLTKHRKQGILIEGEV